MAASILTIIASYMMVKAVRDAVFLTKFDLEHKALVSIGIALCVGFGTAVVTRVLHGRTRLRAIFITNTFVAASLVAIWAAIGAHVPGIAIFFYIWSSFVGLLIIANFWLLANELFDARSAKRLLAILAAGGILGGIVGGELTKWLAETIGAVNLLLVVAAMVMASAFLAQGAVAAGPTAEISASGVKARPTEPKLGEGFALLKSHRHLRLIAVLLLLSTVATTLVNDYQVNSIAKAVFGDDRDAMTAWFGRLTTLLSIASLVVQLLVTSRFMRRFGVTPALFVLPLGVILGTTGIGLHLMLAIPAITVASIARVADGGLRFSIDKSAMELLYLPVPGPLKSKAKPVIDTFVDRLGTASSAVIWLVIAKVLSPMGIGELVSAPLITLAIVAVWGGVILLMRKQYVRALRAALPESNAENKVAIVLDGADQDQVEVVRAALASTEQRHVELALDALTTGPKELMREARAALDHAVPEIRARAFDILAMSGDRTCALKAQRATRDAEPMVRAAAVRYLGQTTAHGADEFVSHADPYVRVAALGHLAAHGPRDAARVSGHIAELLAGPLASEPDLRLGVARAVGSLPLAEARRHLPMLVHDEDPMVAFAAGVSAARVGDLSHVDDLLRALGVPERAEAAREALRGHGAAIIAELSTKLDDRSLPSRARRQIPDLVAAIGSQEAADALAEALDRQPPRVRTRLVRAMWRLHRHGGFQWDPQAVEARVRDEVVAYRAHVSAHDRLGEANTPGMRMLERTLAETVHRDLERIFRLLGLCYPERDVLAAYRGLSADNPSTRAHAVELLDNLLPSNVKKSLVDALERKIDSHDDEPDERPTDERERDVALAELADASDPWLRGWAVYAAGEVGSTRLSGILRRAAMDRDERVREAAALGAQLFAARHDKNDEDDTLRMTIRPGAATSASPV